MLPIKRVLLDAEIVSVNRGKALVGTTFRILTRASRKLALLLFSQKVEYKSERLISMCEH